jgi:chitinase
LLWISLSLIRSFCCSEKEEIDGIDVNTLAPTTADDIQDWVAFISEASKVFRPAGILLSVAMHKSQTYIPAPVYELVDRVHIMTYDMIDEPKRNGKYGYHATEQKMQASLQSFLDKGCPAHKILVGIPAYGRHEQNPTMVKTFSEIFDETLEASPASVSSEATNVMDTQNSWDGYFYDSPSAVRNKVEFAFEKGIAGVFFWELGQDKQHPTLGPGGILLGTAASHMNDLRAQRALSLKDPVERPEL